LIESLTDILYGEKESAKYGKAVATFYKALVDAGLTNEQAYELTQQYMSSLNLAGMIGKAMGEGKGKREIHIEAMGDVHGHDDIGKEIEERVKEKIRKKLEEEE
ncbi:MAG: hypothetical protein ACE5IO_01820, partial [Thermoplasmata archaeon]